MDRNQPPRVLRPNPDFGLSGASETQGLERRHSTANASQGLSTRFSLANLFSKLTVTLSLEGNNLRVIGCRGNRVQFWLNIGFNPSLLQQGFISDPQEMGRIIGDAFRNRSIPTRFVTSALPGYGSQYKELAIPRVAGNVDAVIPREARRQMGITLEQTHLVWQSLGVRLGQERYFVIAIPRLPLEMMAETLQIANIPPAVMDLKPLALCRLVNDQEAIIANAESNSVDVVLMRRGLPVVARSEYIPGATEYDIRIRLLELAAALVKDGDAPLPANPPLLVTGELAGDQELAEHLAETTGCHLASMSIPLRYPPDFPVGRYAVNLGLALR